MSDAAALLYDMKIRKRPTFRRTKVKLLPNRNCSCEGCESKDVNRVRCMGCNLFYCKGHQDAKKSFYCEDCMKERGCAMCLANVQNHWMSCFTSQCLAVGVCEHCNHKVCLQHGTPSSKELICGICSEIKSLAEVIRASV